MYPQSLEQDDIYQQYQMGLQADGLAIIDLK